MPGYRHILQASAVWLSSDLQFLRSDNGPEFASEAVTKWLAETGVETLFIAPSSPCENGYVESLNDKLRDELLNRKLFLHLDEV